MLESVCQVIACGDESHTILYRHAMLLRLCSPVARCIRPPRRESRDMQSFTISGLIVAEFLWNTTLNDTVAQRLRPRPPASGQTTDALRAGYIVALLRSTTFLTFFCPCQTGTLLAM